MGIYGGFTKWQPIDKYPAHFIQVLKDTRVISIVISGIVNINPVIVANMVGRKRGIEIVNTQNFILNTAFRENSKEYQTRPVRAAKYQPGMENSFAVCFSNFSDEGFRFFDDLESAMQFYNEKPAQKKLVNGQIEAVKCYYYDPAPVLLRKKTDAERKYEESEGFVTQSSFCDNEIDDYEVYFLDDNSWIIQESDGTVRVWSPGLGESFFGEAIYEKVTGQEDYIKVAI